MIVIGVSFIVCIVLCIMLWGKINTQHTGFSKDIAPYSKQEVEEYKFEDMGKLILTTEGCDVTIKQKEETTF